MKKKIFSIVGASLTALTPASLLASCSNNKNDYVGLAEELLTSTVEEFKQITKIPRPSYHLAKIRTYLIKQFEDLGYITNRDSYGNIWVDIPATKGYENYKKLILQGHMDMVFAIDKNQFPDQPPDPTSYQIEIDETVSEDYRPVIHSKDFKTSLGADNGIGIATILALIKNPNVGHGPLRIIITSDEEEGMMGVSQLPASVLDADYLLNLDNDTLHEVIIGCMGACGMKYEINDFASETIPNEFKNIWTIDIGGLKGGHSGSDITSGKRGNAIKFAMDILKRFNSNLNTPTTYEDNARLIYLGNIGSTNAIPNNCYMVVASKFNNEEEQIGPRVIEVRDNHKSIYTDDLSMKITVNQVTDEEVLKDIQYSLGSTATANLLQLIGTGTYDEKYSDDHLYYGVIKDDPETSQNISPISLEIDQNSSKANFAVTSYARSYKTEELDGVAEHNSDLWEKLGPGVKPIKPYVKYPAWAPESEHKFADLVVEAWKLFASDPETVTTANIHAGIECTWFKQKKPTLQTTSIGPVIKDCHSPNETLYVDTITDVIQLVLYVFDNMK